MSEIRSIVYNLSMEVPFLIIQISHIDLDTSAAATNSMKPASGVNTPGTMILRMATILLKKTPSICTFSLDLLDFCVQKNTGV